MRALSIVASLAIVAAALAGCVGKGSTDANSGVTPSGLKLSGDAVSSTKGAIVGVVTSDAIEALTADLEIPDLSLTAAADATGTYSFTKLKPGDYLVTAKLNGYDALAKNVTVIAGKIVRLDFTLKHSASLQPYVDVLQFKGFQEAGFGSPVILLNPGAASPNNANLWNFSIKKDGVKSVVVEQRWTDTASGLSSMSVSFDTPDFDQILMKGHQLSASGKSPLKLTVSEAQLKEWGWTEGGDGFVVRSFASSANNTAPVGVITQQTYDVFVSVFYLNGAAPDYTVIKGK